MTSFRNDRATPSTTRRGLGRGGGGRDFSSLKKRRAYNKILERVCLCDAAAAAGDLSFFFFCFRLGSSIFKFAFEIFFLFPFSFQPNDVAKKIASLGIVLLLLLSYRD